MTVTTNEDFVGIPGVTLQKHKFINVSFPGKSPSMTPRSLETSQLHQYELLTSSLPWSLPSCVGSLKLWASLVAQMVKNLSALQETQVKVQSLGQEDPLEKGMATHCSILSWRIPQTEESDRLQSMGS